MKQLDRLLLFQGNRCFFCDQTIPLGQASVEHLVASANGGTNDDENCVACCKSLNAAFGNRPYKEKLRAVLSHRGQFTCPASHPSVSEAISPPSVPPATLDLRLDMVIADLQKRGASKPRKVETLCNTISAVFQKQISDFDVAALIASLRKSGYIIVNEPNVTYSLPPKVV
jgi:HNH endonuclease